MPEVYTCICGGQHWTIQDDTITCIGCGRLFTIVLCDEGLESPGDFSERIKTLE